MGWDVSEKMVDALLAEQVPGIDSKLKALLVFQHCTVHSLSLFDFLAQFQVVGLRVVPQENLPSLRPAAAVAVEGDFPEESWSVPPAGALESNSIVPVYRYSGWRDEQLSVVRLEKLRLHLKEVAEFVAAGCPACPEYFDQLQSFEASLARVVEPVPTLGMVPDDAAAEIAMECDESESVSEPASDPLPVVVASTEQEQAEIAAVLANPKGAQPVVAEVRKDASGRLLASEAKLEEIYKLGERLAMNRVQVQESLCAANKIRRIEDLPDHVADKIVKKMNDRISAC